MKYLDGVVVDEKVGFSGMGRTDSVITLKCPKCGISSTQYRIVHWVGFDNNSFEDLTPMYCPYCGKKLAKENKDDK